MSFIILYSIICFVELIINFIFIKFIIEYLSPINKIMFGYKHFFFIFNYLYLIFTLLNLAIFKFVIYFHSFLLNLFVIYCIIIFNYLYLIFTLLNLAIFKFVIYFHSFLLNLFVIYCITIFKTLIFAALFYFYLIIGCINQIIVFN